MLAINKIDTVERPLLLPIMEAYSKIHTFEQIIPISATLGLGVDELVGALIELLPAGPPLFTEDEISDLPVKFFVEEFIREQITKKTGEEIPYKTTVVVESFKEQDDRVLIQADIHVERPGQKSILIGKGGQMIKQIGMAARKKIEEFLGTKVRLELFVKVTPHWTRNPRQLSRIPGYQEQNVIRSLLLHFEERFIKLRLAFIFPHEKTRGHVGVHEDLRIHFNTGFMKRVHDRLREMAGRSLLPTSCRSRNVLCWLRKGIFRLK